MRKFKFRLATLQKMRESERDQRRAELGQAYEAESILKNQYDEIRNEQLSLLDESREAAGPGAVNIDFLLMRQRHDILLRFQQSQINEKQKQVAEEIARRREALVQANREVKVLEKLREKQLERHQKEEERIDGALLDEVALGRTFRQRKEMP